MLFCDARVIHKRRSLVRMRLRDTRGDAARWHSATGNSCWTRAMDHYQCRERDGADGAALQGKLNTKSVHDMVRKLWRSACDAACS